VEAIAVSKFKARCLALLERVKNTREPILITKRGIPMAQVVPAPEPEKPPAWFGCMKDTFEIQSDILSPLPTEDWEALSR
jgi:prevent-host-death family protein